MGRCRMQRLHAYFQYLQTYYNGANNYRKIFDVPEIAHNKAPNSSVEGNADILIFPCLDAASLIAFLLNQFHGS